MGGSRTQVTETTTTPQQTEEQQALTQEELAFVRAVRPTVEQLTTGAGGFLGGVFEGGGLPGQFGVLGTPLEGIPEAGIGPGATEAQLASALGGVQPTPGIGAGTGEQALGQFLGVGGGGQLGFQAGTGEQTLEDIIGTGLTQEQFNALADPLLQQTRTQLAGAGLQDSGVRAELEEQTGRDIILQNLQQRQAFAPQLAQLQFQRQAGGAQALGGLGQLQLARQQAVSPELQAEQFRRQQLGGLAQLELARGGQISPQAQFAFQQQALQRQQLENLANIALGRTPGITAPFPAVAGALGQQFASLQPSFTRQTQSGGGGGFFSGLFG